MVGTGYERLCVRGELETEQRLQHTTPPAPPAIAARLFRSPGLLNWGPSLSTESWFPQLDLEYWLQALNSNCLVSCLTPGYIIVLRSFNSTRWQPRPPSDLFDRMHLLFTQVHFFFWQLGRIGGQYATVICLHTAIILSKHKRASSNYS